MQRCLIRVLQPDTVCVGQVRPDILFQSTKEGSVAFMPTDMTFDS